MRFSCGQIENAGFIQAGHGTRRFPYKYGIAKGNFCQLPNAENQGFSKVFQIINRVFSQRLICYARYEKVPLLFYSRGTFS